MPSSLLYNYPILTNLTIFSNYICLKRTKNKFRFLTYVYVNVVKGCWFCGFLFYFEKLVAHSVDWFHAIIIPHIICLPIIYFFLIFDSPCIYLRTKFSYFKVKLNWNTNIFEFPAVVLLINQFFNVTNFSYLIFLLFLF